MIFNRRPNLKFDGERGHRVGFCEGGSEIGLGRNHGVGFGAQLNFFDFCVGEFGF